MFRFSSRLGASFARGRRCMTTASTSERVEKTKNFFKDNRQAIINTIGMAYVFYYAIYNTRVQTAWDEREAEVALVKAELDDFKETLSNEKWLAEVDANIKNGSSAKVEVGRKFRKLFKEDTTRFTTSDDANSSGSGML